MQLNFQALAPVLQIAVRPGDLVHAGQILASQDARALKAKIAADDAMLTADQQKLLDLQSPLRPPQIQQPQLEVKQAEAALAAAQLNTRDIAAADGAAVSKAAAAVQTAQAVLAADQQQVSRDASTCANINVSILPSPGQPAQSTSGAAPALTPSDEISLITMCQSEAHQVALDQSGLTTMQAAYQAAVATSQLDVDNAKSTVSTDEAQVAQAQGAQAVALLPSMPSTVAAARAAIATDQATIEADQTALNGAVLRAPVDGIVGAVGGVTGDIASSDGVHQFTAPQALPSQPQSGIQIFPAAPTQQPAPTSPYSSLITLDSLTMKVVAQVSESDVHSVHPGQVAHITLPALPHTVLDGTVTSIDPTAVNQSGKVYYLVELSVSGANPTVQIAAYRNQGSKASQLLSGLSADVSF
jgi:multidrug resistance efflux pump